jgi:hypothetical protein
MGQQVTLTFAPSDNKAASKLRLLTEAGVLPSEWIVKESTLPCDTVGGDGGCKLTLVYTPGADQPAGKLGLDYAYTDAAGRELTGKATVLYASHDYQAYVTDFGGVEDSVLTGGVRQCELDRDGKLSACVKAATSWPTLAANNIVVYGSHAYIGAFTLAAAGVPSRQVSVCNIADDNALVDCAGSGPLFDQLNSLHASRLGLFLLSTQETVPQLSRCGLGSDGKLDTADCSTFPSTIFTGIEKGMATAMTSTDTKVYVSASNGVTTQNLYSCSMSAGSLPNCHTFALGYPEQTVQRMSTGQAGGKAYLYLATASQSDPEKIPGALIKCALDDNGDVIGCQKGMDSPAIDENELIRISDLRIFGSSAYLVTGLTDTSKKIYQCQLNQQTGALEKCVDAGQVEGIRNYSIAVR